MQIHVFAAVPTLHTSVLHDLWHLTSSGKPQRVWNFDELSISALVTFLCTFPDFIVTCGPCFRYRTLSTWCNSQSAPLFLLGCISVLSSVKAQRFAVHPHNIVHITWANTHVGITAPAVSNFLSYRANEKNTLSMWREKHTHIVQMNSLTSQNSDRRHESAMT